MNPYDKLGVMSDATTADIKRAFRDKAKTAHPDAGGDVEDFQELGRALAILSDPAKRAKFDAFGTVDDSVEDPDAGALTVLASLVDQFLSDDDAKHYDLVASMKKEIGKKTKEATEQIARMKLDVKRATDLLARFTAKKRNRIGPLIEHQLETARGAITAAEQNLAKLARAVEILDDHDFAVEPRPAPADMSPYMHTAEEIAAVRRQVEAQIQSWR